MDIVILSNSPGELASWVATTVRKVKEKAPDVRIIVVLTPCPFASGAETEFAESIPGVHTVLSPREYLGYVLSKRSAHYTPSQSGIVVFLGGDILHAFLLAGRLGYPVIGYTVRSSRLNNRFRICMVADEEARDRFVRVGVKPEKIRVVGNLTIEGASPALRREETASLCGLSLEQPIIGLFPGSRFPLIQYSLPVFLKVAEDVACRVPDAQFVLALSPFVTLCGVEKALPPLTSDGKFVGTTGKLLRDGRPRITTAGGVSVLLVQKMQYEVMSASDLVLTIPGTNTAELAFLGTPMVVALSALFPKAVPMGGIFGLLGAAPFVGTFLKQQYLKQLARRVKFAALPNRLCGREIVPEVRLDRDPGVLTRFVLDLLMDKGKRERMSRELQQLMGNQGAVERVADTILEVARIPGTPGRTVEVGVFHG
ncbi:MAG: hypothetical protein HYU64_00730 [Armatimonadetes bacterium]|nr:hypothetical protein [Armatimonadota bacterium]